jgi:hypothetical protein
LSTLPSKRAIGSEESLKTVIKQVGIQAEPGKHLSEEDLLDLSSYIKHCEVVENNLITCEQTLEKCESSAMADAPWWSEPFVAGAIVIIAGGLGFTIAKAL